MSKHNLANKVKLRGPLALVAAGVLAAALSGRGDVVPAPSSTPSAEVSDHTTRSGDINVDRAQKRDEAQHIVDELAAKHQRLTAQLDRVMFEVYPVHTTTTLVPGGSAKSESGYRFIMVPNPVVINSDDGQQASYVGRDQFGRSYAIADHRGGPMTMTIVEGRQPRIATVDSYVVPSSAPGFVSGAGETFGQLIVSNTYGSEQLARAAAVSQAEGFLHING